MDVVNNLQSLTLISVWPSKRIICWWCCASFQVFVVEQGVCSGYQFHVPCYAKESFTVEVLRWILGLESIGDYERVKFEHVFVRSL